MRALRPLPLWIAGAGLGLAAEWALYDWEDWRYWVPDLAAGWSLIACGLVASARLSRSRPGALMTATGFLWFVGNFEGSSVAWIAWLSGHALYLYRGPLVQLVLTYPRGRVASRLDAGAVGAAYAAAILTPVWRSQTAAIALAAGAVVVAGVGYRRAIGRERRERLAAWEATSFVAAVIVATAIARLVDPDTQAATLLLQQLALCVLAGGLLAGLVTEPWSRGGITDLVVDLGRARSGTLQAALARALGDPTLQVGYWSSEAAAYLDETGRQVDLPLPGGGRSVTRVDRDGHPVAALVHDPAVLDDPALVEAVAAASRLTEEYARLRADARAQAAEVEASRRRLLRAGDAERRRLERRLHDGAERRLLRIGELLDGAGGGRPVAHARVQLERTLAELQELARGLHPHELTTHGLAAALTSLVDQSPLSVELSVDVGELPDDVEAAIYFVCAEALTNAAKYASPSHVTVRVSAASSAVLAEVVDDGAGGADLDAGTGLRGVADRLEALGGALRVESARGRGTTVIAELPLT